MKKTIFYRAIIVMSRSVAGEVTSIRYTATCFKDKEAAVDRYGDDFIKLDDVRYFTTQTDGQSIYINDEYLIGKQ